MVSLSTVRGRLHAQNKERSSLTWTLLNGKLAAGHHPSSRGQQKNRLCPKSRTRCPQMVWGRVCLCVYNGAVLNELICGHVTIVHTSSSFHPHTHTHTHTFEDCKPTGLEANTAKRATNICHVMKTTLKVMLSNRMRCTEICHKDPECQQSNMLNSTNLSGQQHQPFRATAPTFQTNRTTLSSQQHQPFRTTAPTFQVSSTNLSGQQRQPCRSASPTFQASITNTNLSGQQNKPFRLTAPTFEDNSTNLSGQQHQPFRSAAPTSQVNSTNLSGQQHQPLRSAAPTSQVNSTNLSGQQHQPLRSAAPTF